jgi:hypothetical protein
MLDYLLAERVKGMNQSGGLKQINAQYKALPSSADYGSLGIS